MGEIHEVDAAAGDGVQLPSFVLSHMTWPGKADHRRRHQLYLSLCASLIRERAVADPDWASRPQWLVPMHVARLESHILIGLKGFDLRMNHRMAAGRMAVPFLRAVEEGRVPSLPKGVKKLSLNEMAKLILDDVEMADIENVATRVWRESLPVIHLCAAMVVSLQEALKAGKPWASYTVALADKVFLALVLRRAMIFEDYLPRSRLAIAPESLHRFHLPQQKDLQK